MGRRKDDPGARYRQRQVLLRACAAWREAPESWHTQLYADRLRRHFATEVDIEKWRAIVMDGTPCREYRQRKKCPNAAYLRLFGAMP